MLQLIAKSLRIGVLTEARPFGREAAFGFPVIDWSRCNACAECANVCPTRAIEVSADVGGEKTVTLSHAACIQCRECVAGCPSQAVQVSPAIEIAAYTRPQLARAATFVVDSATGQYRFSQLVAHQGPGLTESAARLRERIHGRLGRSLHVRQVDAGSCNGCELEIAAATNPLYDMERFGVHIVASPRHADVLLVTGPARRRRRRRLWVQRRRVRRGHLCLGWCRRSRGAGRCLHSGLPTAAAGHPQRVADCDGCSRSPSGRERDYDISISMSAFCACRRFSA